MTENYIQLKKSNILKLGIKDSEGNPTGEFLKFNLEDIELPLKYQTMEEKSRKNRINLKNELTIIEKRQDIKGKKMFSKNEEDKLRAYKKFFDNEVEIYNMFLGENGVQKLLNGEALGWESLADIDEIIEKQILPFIDVKIENITKKIEEKYKNNIENGKLQ